VTGPLEALLLLVLAGWVGADTAAFGQVLVSQPLVAAWLAGAILGDPAAGLAVGVLLQVGYTRVMPLGGVVPEWSGPAAVAGGAIAASAGASQAWGVLRLPALGHLTVALTVALLVGEAGRTVIGVVRRRRARRVDRLVAAARAGDGAAVRRWNRSGALVEAGAGALLAALGVGVGRGLIAVLPQGAPDQAPWVAASVLGAGWGMALRTLTGNRGWETAWFVALAGLVAWRWLA